MLEESKFEDDDEMIDLDEEEKEMVNWKSNLISEDEGSVYIEKYIGSPLSFEISIIKQIKIDEEEKDSKDKNDFNRDDKGLEAEQSTEILSKLGIIIPQLSGAPITLNAIEIENIFGTTNTITAML